MHLCSNSKRMVVSSLWLLSIVELAVYLFRLEKEVVVEFELNLTGEITDFLLQVLQHYFVLRLKQVQALHLALLVIAVADHHPHLELHPRSLPLRFKAKDH